MGAANPRALIADDQPDVFEALRLLLKREGYLIEAVNSPRAVLESLRERGFNVLLVDLNYALDTTSGKEGLDLLAHLKRLDGNLPIVVMTAWGTVSIAVEAMRRGARDFVEKPWDNEHLLATLRAQVATRTAGRHEDDEAAAVQRNLLPREIPGLPGCQVAVSWQPARAVGGDYVDVLALDGPALALGIADVIGKGFGAGLLMSNVQAAVRSIARAAAGTAEVAGRVNRILCGNTAPGRFVTMFYGVLDGQACALRYTNAGHCAPIVVRAAGSIERLEQGGAVLGVFPQWIYEEGCVALAPGDRVVLFTDGITEARDAAGEEFGEERLGELVCAHRRLDAPAILRHTMAALADFAREDDATLLVAAIG